MHLRETLFSGKLPKIKVLYIINFYFVLFLGQLILKIPWKNLYSEPVVAKVEGVYLLARPNTGVYINCII